MVGVGKWKFGCEMKEPQFVVHFGHSQLNWLWVGPGYHHHHHPHAHRQHNVYITLREEEEEDETINWTGRGNGEWEETLPTVDGGWCGFWLLLCNSAKATSTHHYTGFEFTANYLAGLFLHTHSWVETPGVNITMCVISWPCADLINYHWLVISSPMNILPFPFQIIGWIKLGTLFLFCGHHGLIGT